MSEQVEVKIGQVWEECDNRFVRRVRVVALRRSGRVVIVSEQTGRQTSARLTRFRGVSGGYRLVEDAR